MIKGIVSSRVDIIKELGVKACFKTMPHEKKNKQFFGVELELQLPHYSRQSKVIGMINEDMGETVILKEEGCCGYGFEIVTIPATLDYHRQVLWGQFFERGAKLMNSSPGCGLHIHISREPLSVEQQAKMIYFIHDRGNVKFLEGIAGRAHTAHMSTQKTYEAGKEASLVDLAGLEGRTSLHVSKRFGGKTFEFRIFRSTETRQGVMQALEFAAALIEYCGVCKNDVEALTGKAFINWFKGNRSKYSYLDENLCRLDFLKKGSLTIYGMLKSKAV